MYGPRLRFSCDACRNNGTRGADIEGHRRAVAADAVTVSEIKNEIDGRAVQIVDRVPDGSGAGRWRNESDAIEVDIDLLAIDPGDATHRFR